MNFNRSKGISEIIAIILAIVLTLVAFGVAYAFVFSTLGRSSSGTSVNVQGDAVMTGTTTTEVLNIFNTGSVAVNDVSLGSAGAGCLWTGTGSVTINPGSSGTASATACSGLSAGTSVTISLTLTFVNGASQTQIIDLVVH